MQGAFEIGLAGIKGDLENEVYREVIEKARESGLGAERAIELAADATTNVPSSSQELEIQVQNSGESDETGINVTATLNGAALQGQIPALSAGESATGVHIHLSPNEPRKCSK